MKLTPMLHRSVCQRALLALVLAPITPSLVLAQQQTAVSQTDVPPPAEEVLVLSPFEVSASGDVGYVAASSLAGGRTSTLLKDTPAAISVLTREFLDDIAATDFLSAGEWSVNAEPVYTQLEQGLNGGYSIAFRGLSWGFPSRNYFLWYVPSDNYNTERLEFARGPNGVLFGDGNVGGITTIFSKRASFGKNRNVLTFGADSDGGYRATGDFNRILNDRVAMRLNLVRDHYDGWRDNTRRDRLGAHLATTIRLNERDNIRVEGEYGQYDRLVGPTTYTDQASSWNQTTVYDGVTTPAAGTGIFRVATTPYFLDIPGMRDIGFLDWQKSYQTGGTGVQIQPTQRTDLKGDNIAGFPVLPSREFNLAPPDSVVESPYYAYTLYFGHKFSEDFFVELAYNQAQVLRRAPNTYLSFRDYRIDVNKLLPNGAPNPKFGVPFADQQRTRNGTDNTLKELRMLAAWRRDFKAFTQGFNFIGGLRSDDYYDIQELIYRVNGDSKDITNAANRYRVRRYWDEPGRYPVGEALPNIPGHVFDWIPTAITDQNQEVDYAQLLSKTQLFDGRLTALAGVRYDHLSREIRTLNGPKDAVTKIPSMGALDVSGASAISKNYGFVFFPVQWLGVYGNYSETFAPPGGGANQIDGSTPGVTRSSGYDGGIKLNFLDGRLAGSVNYYQSTQAGRLVAGQEVTRVNRIWDNLNRGDLQISSYRDTQDYEGSGLEFELTGNLTKNFRLTANYARPKTKAVRLYAALRNYYDANLPTWQAGANDAGNPNAAQIAADIVSIGATLDGAIQGVTLNDTRDYIANFYGTYKFTDGLMKNIAIGAGANIRGKLKIGSNPADPYDYIYGNEYATATAHLSYQRKIGKVFAIFQLNVYNLFDNQDLIYTRPLTYNAYRPFQPVEKDTVLDAFRYQDPRQIKLTVTLSF